MNYLPHLKEILQQECGIEPPEAGEDFTEMGLDSLDLISFINAAERAYSIEIPVSRIRTIKSLDDLATYLEWRK